MNNRERRIVSFVVCLISTSVSLSNNIKKLLSLVNRIMSICQKFSQLYLIFMVHCLTLVFKLSGLLLRFVQRALISMMQCPVQKQLHICVWPSCHRYSTYYSVIINSKADKQYAYSCFIQDHTTLSLFINTTFSLYRKKKDDKFINKLKPILIYSILVFHFC